MRTVALGKVAKIDRSIATRDDCKVLPYIGLEHIEKETGRFIDYFVPKPQKMLATNFRFTRKHVLYGKLRPYLNKVVLPDFEGVCTTEILPILPSEAELNRTFLWAILLSPTFVLWASSQVSGANLPRLDPKLLADYKIPLPPLDKQQWIAELLVRADRLRRIRRYAWQLGETFLQSVFIQMFGDLNKNPKGLNVEELGKHIINIRYGTGSPPGYQENGIPFIMATNIKNGSIKEESLQYISNEAAMKIPKCKIQSGDLIIVRSGINVGDCGLIPSKYDGAYAAYDLIVQVPYPTNYFVNFIINSSYGKAIIDTISRRAGQPHVNAEQILKIKFPFPPIKGQERFVSIMKRYEHLLAKQIEAERQADRLFQALLERAFSVEL